MDIETSNAIESLRHDLERATTDLRTEMRQMGAEIRTLRTEMRQMGDEITGTLRTEMRQMGDEITE